MLDLTELETAMDINETNTVVNAIQNPLHNITVVHFKISFNSYVHEIPGITVIKPKIKKIQVLIIPNSFERIGVKSKGNKVTIIPLAPFIIPGYVSEDQSRP